MNKLQLILLLLAGLFLSGCFQRNAEGRRTMSFVPDSLIVSQSASVYNDQVREGPLSQDARINGIVRRVTDRLIHEANEMYPEEVKDFKWEIHVFDKPDTVNAYCMPGGKMGIFSGILPVCKNEAALAAVIGHEMAHAILRHSNERVSQQVMGSIGAMALNIYLEKKTDTNPEVRRAIMGVAGLGVAAGFVLPYSRKHEYEADYVGLKLMASAGYDPKEAPNLWRRMMEKTGKSKIPAFMSTHPPSQERINKLETAQPDGMKFYNSSPQKLGKGEQL